MRLAAFLALGLFLAGAAGASEAMRPGAWEHEIVTTAKNAQTGETMSLGTTKITGCMSKERLERPPLNDDRVRQRGGSCTPATRSSQGGVDLWTLSCVVEGKKVDMRLRMRASAEHMTSELTIITSDRQGVAEVSMATTATFKGACQPGMPGF